MSTLERSTPSRISTFSTNGSDLRSSLAHRPKQDRTPGELASRLPPPRHRIERVGGIQRKGLPSKLTPAAERRRPKQLHQNGSVISGGRYRVWTDGPWSGPRPLPCEGHRPHLPDLALVAQRRPDLGFCSPAVPAVPRRSPGFCGVGVGLTGCYSSRQIRPVSSSVPSLVSLSYQPS